MKKIIITILLASGIWSCGTRKVTKTETKDVKTETEVVTEIKTETIKSVDTSEITEIEITPIDNSKPIVVNGKTYFNAKIRHSKKKSNIVVDKVVKIDKNAKKEVKQTIKVKQKDSERKLNYCDLFLSLLFLIVILIIGWKIRKYGDDDFL